MARLIIRQIGAVTIDRDPLRLASKNIYGYVSGNPVSLTDPMGLQASGGGSGGGSGASQQSNCQCDCSRDWSNYWNDYMNFVNQYAVNLGPYAAAMAGGVMPKLWAPATGFRGPLLGSSNPLTSVPRGWCGTSHGIGSYWACYRWNWYVQRND